MPENKLICLQCAGLVGQIQIFVLVASIFLSSIKLVNGIQRKGILQHFKHNTIVDALIEEELLQKE